MMDLQDSCFLPSSTCFKLKSHVNSWLSIDGLRNTKFLKRQEESCVFFLLPCRDGRYMLQLPPASLADLCDHSTESCLEDHCQFSNCQEENVHGYSESSHCGSWFFCKQGRRISISQYTAEFHEEFCFSLEFDDHGCVALSSGLVNKRYWTLDSCGEFLFGTQKIGKRETFQLHEFGWSTHTRKGSWASMAPVRINFRAHTGQYLCGAATVISAVAEVPCCCEEFLLDVNFPPLPPPLKSSDFTTISGQEVQPRRQYIDSVESTHCTVRTANGMFNWSAGADGKLITVQLNEAQGREQFTVSVLPHKHHSMVSISHHVSEDNPDCLCYVSVEPLSRVTCNKLQRGKSEEFVLELVNESRVLIQSVHGYFIGNQEASMLINTSSPSRYFEGNVELEISPKSSIGAWRLRAHGDSRYTLVAATSPRGGDVYLYVDGSGKIMQSNEPSVHFPSLSSMFEIKPVTRGCFITATEGSAQQPNATASLVGFTIKTIRKINGKQRYISAEPNGVLRVNAVRVSRWEIFQLLDVDATVSVSFPQEFSCIPAAVNPLSTKIPIAPLSPLQDEATLCTRGASWFLDEGLSRRLAKHVNYLGGKSIESIESMKKASQVAAMATRMGECVPRRTPASLQELCINQLCLQAAAEVARLHDEVQDSLLVAWVTECLVESCFGIPDDLREKIVIHWCSRQHPKNSCKSSLSTSSSQRDYLSHDSTNGGGIQGPSYMLEHSFWESDDEGFHCHSCNQKGVLKMNPIFNPAHHRYLEVQYHAQNGAAQGSGFLWNLISFAGVSIMSTALLFHFFSNCNKKRRPSGFMR